MASLETCAWMAIYYFSLFDYTGKRNDLVIVFYFFWIKSELGIFLVRHSQIYLFVEFWGRLYSAI